MERFETLLVYQKALHFTVTVRGIVKKLPREEVFGLASQFRRAADSIVLNIAEGRGNTSRKELGKFLDYSIRSGFECIACLDIALCNSFIEKEERDKIVGQAKEITAMLAGLKKSLTRQTSGS
jgi:four helix bundle protein